MYAQITCEHRVKADVIAIERVRPECYMLNSHQIDAVGEVIHHGFE